MKILSLLTAVFLQESLRLVGLHSRQPFQKIASRTAKMRLVSRGHSTAN
jgi:hypothetical protein